MFPKDGRRTNPWRHITRILYYGWIDEMFVLLIDVFDVATFAGSRQSDIIPHLQMLNHFAQADPTGVWTYFN
jgi:hypothetical protein